MFRGTYDFASPPFDWGEDYKRPNVAYEDLIVYEMCVRSFTADESSKLPEGKRGTFLGLKEKVSILPSPVLLPAHQQSALHWKELLVLNLAWQNKWIIPPHACVAHASGSQQQHH